MNISERKKTNIAISIIQGLCLTLIVVITTTVTQVTIPYLVALPGKIGSSNYDTMSSYIPDSFLFMVCMLAAIMVVLEFCKNQKSWSLLSIILLGTFTALCGGGELIGFILCYCFWGCMLAPMLPEETA